MLGSDLLYIISTCRYVVDLLRISLLLYDNSTTNRTNGVRPQRGGIVGRITTSSPGARCHVSASIGVARISSLYTPLGGCASVSQHAAISGRRSAIHSQTSPPSVISPLHLLTQFYPRRQDFEGLEVLRGWPRTKNILPRLTSPIFTTNQSPDERPRNLKSIPGG